MNKLSLLALAALFCLPVYAQDLVPATSEDIQEFDRQVSQAAGQTKKTDKDVKDPNFGSVVKEETKRLKESGESREGFGKWVSAQRRKNTDGRPAAGGNANGTGKGHGGNANLPAAADKGKGKRGH